MRSITRKSLSIGQQQYVDQLEANQGSTIGLAENSVAQQIAGIHYYNYCSQAGEVVEGRLASTEDADLESLVEVGRKAESLGRSIRRVKVGSRKASEEELAEMQLEFNAIMTKIEGGVR